MALDGYNKKRDFNKTPEPEGGPSEGGEIHRFVVQRHEARKLHYDLRLEIGGTLKSWAVPKGPSMNPSDKRLAVRTEDHPLKYLHFHGTIPKGNYGAGDMTIWDSGTFEAETYKENQNLVEQLESGNLKIIFSGKKLNGRFALVRTGNRGGKESWLLIKKRDSHSTELLYNAENLSQPAQKAIRRSNSEIVPGKILSPMLAGSTKEAFNDSEWIYELKWDGYRVLAHITDNGVLLQSRNGQDFGTKFPKLAKELEAVEQETILDGELVILDAEGVSKFGELQNYPQTNGTLRYYIFDMLYLNGYSMLGLPLTERKSLIPEIIHDFEISRYCDHISGMGIALYENAVDKGLEGVMAKAASSDYSPGFRTEKWLKIKSVQSEDALICGYTDSVNGGAAFGSLILGQRSEGTLKYIGNCGSGFSETLRLELLESFEGLRTETCPFAKKPNLKGRKPNWMVPVLECEVRYSERTKNGLLRHPVFKRLLNSSSSTNTASESTTPVTKTPYKSSKENIEIDGLPVYLSNLDKVYWPESGLTKFDLIDYYIQISETILPYLKDRPQSLHRHPNGIMGEDFYQKDNESVPEWMETVSIYSKSSERDIRYLLCQNTASLVHMANLGCIEINPWNSTRADLDLPDYGIIDLDPPEGMAFKQIAKIAMGIKDIMDEAGIHGQCKTSGSKGLHIYLPMGGKYTYEETRNFIKLICYYAQEREPALITMERRIKDRNGKLYLDYLQNRRGHTVASVYSVRPVLGSQVSTPLHWHELEDGILPSDFTIENMTDRIASEGDLFAAILGEGINMDMVLTSLD